MEVTGLCFLILISVLSVISDFRGKRIPNYLICSGWAVGLLYQIVLKGLSGLYFFLFGSLVPIFILFVLFIFRMLGAGDIKLLSVLGGFLGSNATFVCIILSFLFEALIAIIKFAVNRNLLSRLQYLAEYFKELFLEKKIKPYYVPVENDNNIVHFSHLHYVIMRWISQIIL